MRKTNMIREYFRITLIIYLSEDVKIVMQELYNIMENIVLYAVSKIL